ncbi:Hypothetical protein RRSL_00758 [Ralstonia solanacearum UW551]|uniref:Uncharacterized protein n=1 Tax=Ralstonia solanacearum (strain UW551) TaxID=342110 RepID=A0AB33V805_RALSU|nr:Hypothetical protein RRSL_00758 [Ralstonia solanacearum UW551]
MRRGWSTGLCATQPRHPRSRVSCIRAVAAGPLRRRAAQQCHAQPSRAAMARGMDRYITVSPSIAPLMRATLPSAGDTRGVTGVACTAGREPSAVRIGADACRPMPHDTGSRQSPAECECLSGRLVFAARGD